MNNKGQSLVTFILIMPILFLIVIMVYNIGSMVLLKNELSDINRIAISYGLDHIEEDNLVDRIGELIKKNKSDIDNISIDIMDDKIYVVFEDSIDNITNFNGLFMVKSSYVGYMDEGKKIIERNN